jgi:hypothetical protein
MNRVPRRVQMPKAALSGLPGDRRRALGVTFYWYLCRGQTPNDTEEPARAWRRKTGVFRRGWEPRATRTDRPGAAHGEARWHRSPIKADSQLPASSGDAKPAR